MAVKIQASSTRVGLKEQNVVAILRQQIVSGQLGCGERILPRRELEQRFKVSSATIQRGLSQLVNDGFVQVRGPQGTFVSITPPHLSRYGLVLPYRPTECQPWRRFWTALWNEGMRLEQSQPIKVPLYYGAKRARSDMADQAELVADVAAQRLAGLFLVSPSKSLMSEPGLNAASLPRVVMASEGDYPGCTTISVDMRTFFDRAVESLASRGRRRIAVLTVPHSAQWDGYLAEAMASASFTARSFWTQMIPQDHAAYARNAMHLMFHRGHSERPDGLIIADDNLVEFAAEGLLAAGVNVPDELDVVAHCNHPWPTPSVLPVRRLGFDAREVMRLAIESIDTYRETGKHVSHRVRAMFVDELQSD